MQKKILYFAFFLIIITLIVACGEKPVCGNGIVEKGETKITCCKDTGCPGSQSCDNNQCIDPKCSNCQYLMNSKCYDAPCCSNEDCNDNDDLTTDKCSSPGRKEARCSNLPLQNFCGNGVCESNEDCTCADCDGKQAQCAENQECIYRPNIDLMTCVNSIEEEGSSVTDTSSGVPEDSNSQKYILPNEYAKIMGCSPFNGEENAPFKILFVNLGDAPYFDQILEDTIQRQLKTIAPFSEYFESMSFYKINVERTEDLECKGFSIGLAGSGLACNGNKILERIKKQCILEDERGIFIMVVTESAFGGSGGAIIYFGSNSELDVSTQLDLMGNVGIHELGHNLGFADLYYGSISYYGVPSGIPLDDQDLENIRAPLNVDGPGCPKWCKGHKPVEEYSETTSATCLTLQDKESCIAFSREIIKAEGGDFHTCTETNGFPDCCVWSDDTFDYFESHCVPVIGSEDIGKGCVGNSGCYFGAHYGNYAWRPVLRPLDSIMYTDAAQELSSSEEQTLRQIFDCCFTSMASEETCKSFRNDYANYLYNYGGQRIGSCGMKS